MSFSPVFRRQSLPQTPREGSKGVREARENEIELRAKQEVGVVGV
jgi:hypothetical protein